MASTLESRRLRNAPAGATERNAALRQRPAVMLLSAGLVATGHVFVLQRSEAHAQGYLSVRGDTAAYVAMIEGRWQDADRPFRDRTLVPLLAAALPLRPLDAMRAITYASLFGSYVLILVTCGRLGIPARWAAGGLVVAFAAPCHLYSYHNPFLTDAFGLLMFCVMLFAWVTNSLPLFLLGCIGGVLAHESTAVLVPVWLLRDWRRGLGILVIGVACYAAPRWVLSRLHPSPGPWTALQAAALANLNSAVRFTASILRWLGFACVLAPFGLYVLTTMRRPMAEATVFLLVGALAASVVVTDIGRMCATLTPVIAVAVASLLATLADRGRAGWAALFGLAAALQATATIPNALFDERHPWIAGRWPGIALMVVAALLSLAAALPLCLPKAGRDDGPRSTPGEAD